MKGKLKSLERWNTTDNPCGLLISELRQMRQLQETQEIKNAYIAHYKYKQEDLTHLQGF